MKVRKKVNKKEQKAYERFIENYSEIVKYEKSISRKLQKNEKIYQKIPHVIGYGVGHKIINGCSNNELSAIFFVDKKIPIKKLKKSHILPSFITVNKKNIFTDVVVLDKFVPFSATGYNNNDPNNQKIRPLKMGTSIRPFIPWTQTATSGVSTAGALVADIETGARLFILTAGHGFPNEGDDVIQPFHKKNRKVVSTVPIRVVKIYEFISQVTKIADDIVGTRRTVDAAIIEVSPATKKEIVSLGIPKAPLLPIVGLYVQKSGAKTGLTYSIIDFTGVGMFNANVYFPTISPQAQSRKVLFFVRDIPPSPPAGINIPQGAIFAKGGDSGSLVVAGHPFLPNLFGPGVMPAISHAMGTPSITPSPLGSIFPSIRNRIKHAALGMVLAGASGVPNTGPLPTSGTIISTNYTICQEIQIALDAFQVKLVL